MSRSPPPPPVPAARAVVTPRACRACGVEESSSVRLERCAACTRLPWSMSAYYCSRECQKADWPAHWEWHVMQEKAHAAFVDVSASMPTPELGAAASEYEQLVLRGQQQARTQPSLEREVRVRQQHEEARASCAGAR